MSETLGFIGVGRMGSRMAKRLLNADYPVAVYDVDAARLDELGSVGATVTDSVADLVETATVVFTSLPTDETVRSVYLDTDGVVEHLTEGMAVVETSTVLPDTLSQIGAAVDDRGISADVVDAPVIGVPATAEKGDLTILVGSADDAFDRVKPLLDPLGSKIEHVGDIGTGKAFKLVNNVISYGNYAVAAEAFALGRHLGMDEAKLFDVVESGVAGSAIATEKLPKAFDEDFVPGFTINGAQKDLLYAMELAGSTDTAMPIAQTVLSRYEFTSAIGAGELDYASLLPAFTEGSAAASKWMDGVGSTDE